MRGGWLLSSGNDGEGGGEGGGERLVSSPAAFSLAPLK